MKAGHKGIGGPGEATNKGRADGNELTEFRAYRQILIAFAGNFTAMATNALFGILKQVVFTHYPPPNSPEDIFKPD